MIRFFTFLGEFTFWLLWPDTYACVLIKRCFSACPYDEQAHTFKTLAACENVRQLEEAVCNFETYWAFRRNPDAREAETSLSP